MGHAANVASVLAGILQCIFHFIIHSIDGLRLV